MIKKIFLFFFFFSISTVAVSQILDVNKELQKELFHAYEEPRTILALYKSTDTTTSLRYHPLHRFLEMPLNHLGLQVYYWDMNNGLPDISKYPPLRGIVSWFYSEEMDKPEAYLEWASRQIRQGKKFLVIGEVGASKDLTKKPVERAFVNNFLSLLGIRHQDRWVNLDATATLSFYDDKQVFFEEKSAVAPRGVPAYVLEDSEVTPFIMLEMIGEKIPVATISKNGGMVVVDYFLAINPETALARWVINPFHYLKEVFETTDLPKLDVTTINGRRLYFSHIDGDGWRSVSHIPEYAKKRIMCAEVVRKKAIEPYPDLPVTVAPIAADLDPEWFGNEESQKIARDLFELPYVQGGSHTYSHPFAWAYYNNDEPAKREEFEFGKDGVQRVKDIPDLHDYKTPRAFFKKPFDLEAEVITSLAYVQKFMPQGKHVRLLQWSGNCEPFEKALAILAQKKYLNINGGDSRFDRKYPSYSSVCSVGRRVGDQVQIYAVNSNENTYTDGWRERYHAFKYLKQTFDRTESPIRVKGMNIYYHMYSAEKEASLSALLSDLKYAREQQIIPIEAEHYAEIGQGFFAAKIVKEGALTWRIKDRGALPTVRFDKASDKWIDFEKSVGLLGGRHYQGSLYVAIDPAALQPVIALKEGVTYYAPPVDAEPYLVDSRWRIAQLQKEGLNVSFSAYGYGPAEMTWVVPHPGLYSISTIHNGKTATHQVQVDHSGKLSFKLNLKGHDPHEFKIVLIREEG